MQTPSFSNHVDSLQIYDNPNPNNNYLNNSDIMSQIEEESPAMFQNAPAGSMGLAFTVDSFNSFEPLGAGNSNMSDMWTFTQD